MHHCKKNIKKFSPQRGLGQCFSGPRCGSRRADR